MIVNDLDLECITIVPPETDSPLIIDSNAVLAGPIAAELLQAVSWRDAKVRERFCRVERRELPEHGSKQVSGIATNGLASEERFGVPVGEAFDHFGR